MCEACVGDIRRLVRAQCGGLIQSGQRIARVVSHEQRHAELVERVGLIRPQLEHAAERALRHARIAALPRDDAEAEVRLPQIRIDDESAVERLAGRVECGVARECCLPRALQGGFELRLAQTEAQPMRVTGDLSSVLDGDDRVELTERGSAIAHGEQHTREIQADHGRRSRGERLAVVRDGLNEVATGVHRGAVRGMQLPAHRARGHGAGEGGLSGRGVAPLERDDREQLLRRAVRLAVLADASKMRECGCRRGRVRVELSEAHQIRVRQRPQRVRVLHRYDRPVGIVRLGPELAEDVVRAPGARADRHELFERAHLVGDVAALEGLRRDDEDALLGRRARGIGARRVDELLESATQG